MVADKRSGVLYTTWEDPESLYPRLPLAVRLEDDSFLANGAAVPWPRRRHQALMLRALEDSGKPFGVVPFDSIAAAWTDGEIRDWNQAPFTLLDLRREVEIVIPSAGERWKEVLTRDKYGRAKTEQVHTLGDSVIRVRDQFYLSGVDETGRLRGIYFLAQLVTDGPPGSYEEAMSYLKPKTVQDAEARGAYVKRQGEWFAIPTMLPTSKLLREVEQARAVRRERHVLGRDGHHQLEEAVIFRCGPRRGEVYARGVMSHVRDEHFPLELGIRWHRIVHNVQGAS